MTKKEYEIAYGLLSQAYLLEVQENARLKATKPPQHKEVIAEMRKEHPDCEVKEQVVFAMVKYPTLNPGSLTKSFYKYK